MGLTYHCTGDSWHVDLTRFLQHLSGEKYRTPVLVSVPGVDVVTYVMDDLVCRCWNVIHENTVVGCIHPWVCFGQIEGSMSLTHWLFYGH